MKLPKIGLYICLLVLCLSSVGDTMEKKNITRFEDPVIIEGGLVKDLMGCKLEELALMVYNSGKFTPIPFQIDEKHKNGTYAFVSGEQASTDEDPSLDKNDEILFMINDLGNRAPPGTLPERALVGMALKIVDPVDSGTGWAYLCKFCKEAPHTSVSYVRLEIDKAANMKRFIGTTNTTGMLIGAPLDAIIPVEGRFILPDGTKSPDLLDRFKLRGKLQPKYIFFASWLINNLDNMIKEDLVAWNDGPIRVIYKGDGYFKIAFFKVHGYTSNLVKAYRNHLNIQVQFGFPIQINTVLKSFPLTGYLDFSQEALGYRVYNAANPPSRNIILDGKISKDETNIDVKSRCDWIAGCGPDGGVLFRFTFPKEGPWSQCTQRLYIKEDLTTPDPPEEFPGGLFVGLAIGGIEDVTAKSGLFDIYFYFLENFVEPGMEKPIVNILDHPVLVFTETIRPVNSSLSNRSTIDNKP